jgi:predicted phosphohydrolase
VAGDPGWREPRLGLLRTAAFVVLAGLLVWVVVVEEGPNDLGAIGSLLGAMMVLLGFAALIQWPPRR